MDIADSVKNQGLLGFLRLATGGPEISLEFKKGEYSKALTVTLDGHTINAFLTLEPSAGVPNMRLTITDKPAPSAVVSAVVPVVVPAVPAVVTPEPEVPAEVPVTPPETVVPVAPPAADADAKKKK